MCGFVRIAAVRTKAALTAARAKNTAMAQRRLKVFFDGGCRPNPGQIEVAVVTGGKVHHFGNLGLGSNTDAEWQALICAMELARSLGLTGYELIGDSVDVIGKAKRVLQAGSARPGCETKLLALAEQTRPAQIRWIKRAQNLAGIALNARHPR